MSNNHSQNLSNVKNVYVLLMLYVHCESAEGCGESLLLIVTQGPRITETQSTHVLLWPTQQGAGDVANQALATSTHLIQITSTHLEVSKISHKSHLI